MKDLIGLQAALLWDSSSANYQLRSHKDHFQDIIGSCKQSRLNISALRKIVDIPQLANSLEADTYIGDLQLVECNETAHIDVRVGLKSDDTLLYESVAILQCTNLDTNDRY